MLCLKINDQNVDLGDDFSFTMNLKSPLFNEIGNYSYPFRIPATPRNAILLGFPHRLEGVAQPYVERQARFEWNGLTLFCGTARLKTAGATAYEGVIFDSTGDFYYQIKNRSLQQLDMGEKVFASENEAIMYLSNTLNRFYPEVPIACPLIKNSSYFDPPVQNTELEHYNYEYQGNVLRLFTLSSNQRTVIVPMLYLRYLLERLFSGLGYLLDDRFFSSHADFNRLVVYNSTSCNNAKPVTPPRVPEDYGISRLIFNLHVPRIGINDFLKSLENYFGLAMFVDNITRSVTIRSMSEIVHSSEYEEFTPGLISCFGEYEEKPTGYKLSMSLDPDDHFFNILTGFEDQIMAAYSGSVADLADLPAWPQGEIGSIYWVENQNNFFLMDAQKNWGVTPLMGILRTRFFFRGDGQALESKFSPLYYDPQYMTATVTHAMNKYREITPRLLFVDHYSFMGSAALVAKDHTDNFSLYYPWETGLFNQWWKVFLGFTMSTRLVKFTRAMTFTQIREFDFSRKYMVRGRKYLFRSLQVTLKRDRIAPVSLEGYLCED